jgi:hypothetical protein
VVAPVLAAERRHAPVVVHVAVANAARPAAPAVRVAVPPRVRRRGRHVPVAGPDDEVGALGRRARVLGAVPARAARVAALVAPLPLARVRAAEGRLALASLGAAGGFAAIF